MFNPFDAAMKSLVVKSPAAWLRLAGASATSAQLLEDADLTFVDTDLTTVTTTCDKVFRVEGDVPSLFHLEFEAEGKNVPRRVLRYNLLLSDRHEMSVESIVLLLRREAARPGINGMIERFRPDGSQYLRFEYGVIKLWEIPAERLLEGEIGTLSITPIADLADLELPEVLQRMEQRVNAEIPREEHDEFWTTTFLMMGLRFSRETSLSLLKGVTQMRASDTYMMILEEGEAMGEAKGRIEGERSILLRQGRKRFGEPTSTQLQRLEEIDSLSELEDLALRLLEVENWQELFVLPSPQ